MKNEIRISVRNLVEFILRSGDIDRGGGKIESDAMAAGARMHRYLQSKGGSSYHSEVFLSRSFSFPEKEGEISERDFTLTVEGRADGIISGEDRFTIDEIKGVFREVKDLTDPVPVHEAQARCYAYLFLRDLREKHPEACGGENTEDRRSGGAAQETSRGKKKGGKEKKEKRPPMEIDGTNLSAGALDFITVQMTYVNLETSEIRILRQRASFEELETWFFGILSQYRKWAEFQIVHKSIRQASIRTVEFPYPYRKGQRDLVAAVYQTIRRKKKLFIQAPTGSGKTLAAVFPAVRAVGEGYGDRIFYLTARTITRTVAEESFSLLQKNGLIFPVVPITAKEKICPMLREKEGFDAAKGPEDIEEKEENEDIKGIQAIEGIEGIEGIKGIKETGNTPQAFREAESRSGPPCSPKTCSYAKGHFDRINDAVYEMITEGTSFQREDILAQAEKWKVCPFELSLDLTLWLDGVICDYNYLFDPTAKLNRFFGQDQKGDYIFLIDEAHNLVDRGRDMYSADLSKEEFLELKGKLKHHPAPDLLRGLNACNRFLLEEKKKYLSEAAGMRVLEGLGEFPTRLLNLCASIEKYLENPLSASVSDDLLAFYFRLLSFIGAQERITDKYMIYEEMLENGIFSIRIFCVDPSADLEACMGQGRAAALFSATLLPVNYYKSLLSTREDDYAVYASSTFDPGRRKILIGADTSSRYTLRGPDQYRRMAEYIKRTVHARPGNYMVFFSSYRMMEDVADVFSQISGQAQGEEISMLLQKKRMSEKEREDFLLAFSEREKEDDNGVGISSGGKEREEIPPDRQRSQSAETPRLQKKCTRTLVGFCVMGSFFSEGIDLKKDSLIGAVVVGTGLPQVGNERELLKHYYEGKGKDGFFYSYICPGMNKVLQAAGRVIRTEEDAGVIVLLDERFTQSVYRSMFPREWTDTKICTLDTVDGELQDFWKRMEQGENQAFSRSEMQNADPAK